MRIFVDIDNVICGPGENGNISGPEDYKYSEAEPIKENIEKINSLYEEGHEIIYWSGRGFVTGKDWEDLTRRQLNSWGCKYHEIRLTKPPFDVFIDDKAFNSDWLNNDKTLEEILGEKL